MGNSQSKSFTLTQRLKKPYGTRSATKALPWLTEILFLDLSQENGGVVVLGIGEVKDAGGVTFHT